MVHLNGFVKGKANCCCGTKVDTGRIENVKPQGDWREGEAVLLRRVEGEATVLELSGVDAESDERFLGSS